MKLTAVHLLITFRCTRECDHCFVWGSPCQRGAMTIERVRQVLAQAKELGSVEWVYFEGGEPFQYYAVLLSGARAAARMGFRVGVVSNAYWATDVADAMEYLGPLAGLVDDFTVSADWYHWDPELRRHVEHAFAASEQLGIPFRVCCIVDPGCIEHECELGRLPVEEAPVMYRGRAAVKLAPGTKNRPWSTLSCCGNEDLCEPSRVHIDPVGHVHVCQGISIGRLDQETLREICESYDPESNPIVSPLLEGGPVELALRYGLNHEPAYADNCHACYEARAALRGMFPDILAPDQMYGVCKELDALEAFGPH